MYSITSKQTKALAALRTFSCTDWTQITHCKWSTLDLETKASDNSLYLINGS